MQHRSQGLCITTHCPSRVHHVTDKLSQDTSPELLRESQTRDGAWGCSGSAAEGRVGKACEGALHERGGGWRAGPSSGCRARPLCKKQKNRRVPVQHPPAAVASAVGSHPTASRDVRPTQLPSTAVNCRHICGSSKINRQIFFGGDGTADQIGRKKKEVQRNSQRWNKLNPLPDPPERQIGIRHRKRGGTSPGVWLPQGKGSESERESYVPM